ncbi:dihydrofolate reductase family protein [Fictibacillus fluitans]|uniref:Dihydrofolate reductase family protein n=1 Tax=Fictibacillus fluitans TaxID=3058422 RepID=A0ABT8HW36_9BACL|nr:dihydrofolate reductase family protein [Fictibacillus sp. NE201]MDN4524992.1 dihydrofolate reductase family protein [Fictibacillus sp. NE201]
MDKKRKVVLYIASSLDGFIAGKDGDLSWLASVERPGEDYGYAEFMNEVDTVIMGRKTYDTVLSFEGEFHHKGRKCYVLSRSKSGSDGQVEYYNGDVRDLIDRLKQEKGKNIFLDGGAEAVKVLKEHDLIDEYVISIIPVFLGSGIRLFHETDNGKSMTLDSCKTFESGLVQLKYS